MLELIFIGALLAIVWWLGHHARKLSQGLQDVRDYEAAAQEREDRLIEETKAEIDRNKPWPVKLVHYHNGIQLARNLDSLEVRYGTNIIGTYDGWKIYDYVYCQGETFIYDNVVVKRDGRFILPDQAPYLILSPGLAYRHVPKDQADLQETA